MKPQTSIVKQIKAARRVSVPLVAITTPDPAATIRTIGETFAASAEPPTMIVWDLIAALQPIRLQIPGAEAIIERGKQVIANYLVDGFDPTKLNPSVLLELSRSTDKLPPNSVLFAHLANRWLIEAPAIQAAWNLRDEFKSDRRMVIFLGPAIDVPPELAGDFVVFDEPLPDAEALTGIIEQVHGDAKAKIDKETLPRAVEAVQGLPAFQAEQVVAMSLTSAGLDIPNLWERKRRQIELTPGLKVHRELVRFADIGGVATVKDFLSRVMVGQAKPDAIVFIDEIEKFMAGSSGASGGDSSGVSQDQLGTLLAYMQDNSAAGCIFVGPPGSAKSMVAKACGNEAGRDESGNSSGIPTIQLDLGAMKGSLVGQSEQSLRAALKVITSVSNGKSLWIATCNAIADLPPELRRRFTLGTFFFDLPDEDERRAIWKIYQGKYKRVEAEVRKVNEGGRTKDWTGAEIRQCCDIAWRLDCSLIEAAQFVVPVAVSARDVIDRLRKSADGRFLSASHPGVYQSQHNQHASTKPAAGSGKRAMAMAEE